ncbi:MAG: nucleotidyl transferase AbiEii/AbiGii toxin family protein [Parcubacteria group bacterium]|jgi:predicted nucleotidyltransferase component of viral defense system
MLNKNKHKLVMTQIVKDIYADISISSLLGFKGGTAAYFFYALPRFSVDLDFDLLEDSDENRSLVFEKIEKILLKYGEIKDSQKKFSTIFFALSYGAGEHQIKVEVNTRKTGAHYGMQSYFGIPVLVVTKASMFAGKLMALTGRKIFAARDLYDTYFFLKQGWDMERDVFVAYGEKSVKDYLGKCITLVENVPTNKMLVGLGELVDEKEKTFVRNKLKEEVLFLLKVYRDNEK